MSNNFDIFLWLRRERKRRAQKIIEGAPPLTYTAKNAGTLKNYRIYGNTVDGESVGDLVTSGEHAGEYCVPVTVEGKNLFDVSTITLGCYINDVGQIIQNDGIDTSDFIKVSPNTNYTYKGAVIYDTNIIRIAYYDQSKNFISRYFTPGNAANGETVTTPSNCEYVKLSYDNVITNLMLNSGSEPLPYEPYQPPVTTPIYLPEQIKKVGDEAEYISYSEQKMHRVGADDIDVTLPALPTIAGTNTLSVGTQVQPSKVMVRGKIIQE